VEGARQLKQSLISNVIITEMVLTGNRVDYNLLVEISRMVESNDGGSLSIQNYPEASPDGKDRVISIIWILKKVSICNDLYWIILGMFKLYDFKF